MSTTAFVVNALLGSAAVAAAFGASEATAAGDSSLKRELQALAQRRIYFGHQSVGFNIIDGLRELAAEQQVALRIAEAEPGGPGGPAFAHGQVAANGDPLRKFRSFEEAFASGGARGADVAFVKLCYVDFTAGTDISSLFAAYRETMARLRAAHPGTTFVHVTAPLTTVQGGAKALLKRLLGRTPYGIVENLRREEWNDLVRRSFANDPVFDLARVEATRPDGGKEAIEWQGRSIPTLVAGYTDDGGHLNAEGRRRAARELVSVLARLTVQPAGARGP